MSAKLRKIAIFSDKVISNIFFSIAQPHIFLECLCLSGRYVSRLQWQRGEIPSHSLLWGHEGEDICLGNNLNGDFLVVNQFQIFFSVSQPLIF